MVRDGVHGSGRMLRGDGDDEGDRCVGWNERVVCTDSLSLPNPPVPNAVTRSSGTPLRPLMPKYPFPVSGVFNVFI